MVQLQYNTIQKVLYKYVQLYKRASIPISQIPYCTGLILQLVAASILFSSTAK